LSTHWRSEQTPTSDAAWAHLARRFVGLDAAGLRAYRDDPDRSGRIEVEDWGLR
jgi:hypothetical protein